MRLVFLGIIMLALVSNASAFSMEGTQGSLIESTISNGNEVTGIISNEQGPITNYMADMLNVGDGSASFDGFFWYLDTNEGQFTVQLNAKNAQGYSASTQMILDGTGVGLNTEQSVNAVDVPGIVSANQKTSIGNVHGTLSAQTDASTPKAVDGIATAGASSGDFGAGVIGVVTQPNFGWGYIGTMDTEQMAVASDGTNNGIQGAVATNEFSGTATNPTYYWGCHQSSGVPELIATAFSSSPSGSTITEAYVQDGRIGYKKSGWGWFTWYEEKPIEQLSAAGTITGNDVLSLENLGFSGSRRVKIGSTPFSAYEVPLSQYNGVSGSFSATAAENAVLNEDLELVSEQYKLLHGHDLAGDSSPGASLYAEAINNVAGEWRVKPSINGDLGGIVYAYQGTAGTESGRDAVLL